MWDRLPEVEAPVLIVTGERDGRYRALGERLVHALPHATAAVVPGAGHATHLEQPAAFTRAVLPFLG